MEFMIDTGCQVTILATPADIYGYVPFDGTRGTGYEIDMTGYVVFPGLSCNMALVVASIGSEGLLGTEALQSCLPHQLDLQTGQLWADGRSTLQLHQQRQAIHSPHQHQYAHVFPAPGEPVMGRSTAVQHEIKTNDARPVQCGPRQLALAGLRTEQTCVTQMLEGGQIEPSDSVANFQEEDSKEQLRITVKSFIQ